MNTYRLTSQEARQYDDGGEQTDHLMADLRSRFGRLAAGEPVTTEVRHPDGYIVGAYTAYPVLRDYPPTLRAYPHW